MHPFLAKNLFYKTAFAIRGENVAKCLIEIEDFYSQSLGTRKDIQLKKLKHLLDFAYRNNAYYREQFDQHGLTPDDISTLDDICKIPCLTKTTLQMAGDKILSREAPRTLVRTTSGSTGIPLILKKDVVASAYMAAQMCYVYSWYDIGIGDKLARVWGVPFGFRKKLITNIKDWALNRRRLSAFNISPQSCRKYYRTLLDFKPKYMQGLPSTISALATMLKELELDPAHIGIKAVISTGEVLFDNDRSLINNAFGCPVVDEYGTTETGIIAFQSPDGDMVESTHNHIVEVIDPDTGKPVAPGETGQVCVTELHSYGVPMIRYLVGDLAVQGNEKSNELDYQPSLNHILGRVSDLIVCPDGKKVAAAVLDYSFGPCVKQFKAHQKSLSHLDIYVVKAEDFSDDAFAKINKKLRSKLGEEMTIEYKFVDSIPASPSGKMTVLESDLANSEVQRPGAAWTHNSGGKN